MFIGFRQTIHSLGRYIKPTILHFERAKNPFLEKGAEGLARQPFDQSAEHVGINAIGVRVAGLMRQGQLADFRDKIAETGSGPEVRAFVKLREMLATHKELAHKMEHLEKQQREHGLQLAAVYTMVKRLMEPPLALSWSRHVCGRPGCSCPSDTIHTASVAI